MKIPVSVYHEVPDRIVFGVVHELIKNRGNVIPAIKFVRSVTEQDDPLHSLLTSKTLAESIMNQIGGREFLQKRG